MLSNKGLGIKVKKCLYEAVIVPTALYGAGTWGMRSAERRKLTVLEMKCLRSLVGLSRMEKVRNEEVRRRIILKWRYRAERIREYRHSLAMWKGVSTVWP